MSQIIPIYIPTYISDQNYNPARVQPRLLFYNGQVDCESFYVNDGGTVNEVTQFPYFDNYSVVSGSQFPTTGSKSLLYFNENTVYGATPTSSLYQTYWETYVSLLYNPITRLLYCSAIIPLADYFKMELNDIVQWRGNYYHLRAINEYNLSNGECKLQLLGPILGDILPDIIPAIACAFDFEFGCSPTPTTTLVPTTVVPTTLVPTTTTTSPPTCFYEVGDLVEGGVVAFASPSGAVILGLSDIGTGILGCEGLFYPITVPLIDQIGRGWENTQIILANCATSSAAILVSDYTGSGYTDWCLGNRGEWQQIYNNRAILNAAGANLGTSSYWQSSPTEFIPPLENKQGCVADFATGNMTNQQLRNNTYTIRPIRYACDLTPPTPTTTTTAPPAECTSYNVQGTGLCEYEDCSGTPLSFFCDSFCDFTICTNGVISVGPEMILTDAGSC